MELGVTGATVFRGLEGYGETAEIHRHHLMRRDQPILVMVIDQREVLDRLIPVVENMMDTGLIAISEVSVKRVRRPR
jgi:PII-like signaling protein